MKRGMRRAAKHEGAFEMVMRAIDEQVGRHGVGEHILRNVLTPEQFDKIAKSLPLRKVGRPQDIANAVAFLASSKAGHVTGQVLSVSGGYSMIG